MEAQPQIEIIATPGKQQAKVSDLFLWKDNPKDVEADDYARLKRQFELGEHSPILITTEGEVLGGNTRLALYKELGKELADVVVVDFQSNKGGKINAYVNGQKAARIFNSVGQAKLEYALSHNGQIGKTNREKLAEMAMIYELPTQVYEVPTYVQPLENVVQSLSPDPVNIDRATDENTVATDKLDSYMNGAIKQIVLLFDNEQYLQVLDRLDALRDPDEDNTSLFLRLLKSYEDGNRS